MKKSIRFRFPLTFLGTLAFLMNVDDSDVNLALSTTELAHDENKLSMSWGCIK